MSPTKPSNTPTDLRLEKIVPGIGTIRRWRILVELAKGERGALALLIVVAYI